jgi:hypothetical protein
MWIDAVAVRRTSSVIAGFGGGLISHVYVEERVLPSIDRAPLTISSGVRKWWHQVSRSLGPASSTRAILDVAAAPLLGLLEHDRVFAAPFGAGLCAPLPSANAVLAGIPWAEPTASIWRRALGLGLTTPATWAIVCNGRTIRIIDCSRSWTRAAIEFDFDPLVSGPKGVTALWALARAPVMAGRDASSLRGRIAESDARVEKIAVRSATAFFPRCPRSLAPSRSILARKPIDRWPSNRRSRWSIACCFCYSPRRDRWCRPGTRSIAMRTRSRR